MAKRKHLDKTNESTLLNGSPSTTPKRRKSARSSLPADPSPSPDEIIAETTKRVISRAGRGDRRAATGNQLVSGSPARSYPSNGRAKQVHGAAEEGEEEEEDEITAIDTPTTTPSKSTGRRRGRPPLGGKATSSKIQGQNEGSQKRTQLFFSTPTKASTPKDGLTLTPTTAHKADRSARRKSARTLQEQGLVNEAVWDDDDVLARQIREEDDEIDEEDDEEDLPEEDKLEQLSSQPATPSKKRGRKRLLTPEGDVPPQERFFFQNRAGPVKTSNNTLSSLSLLTHDEYFSQMRDYEDLHEPDQAYLLDLHARSFPQWRFELSEQFSICLYGWGSKRKLVHRFAEWLYSNGDTSSKIVVVNGYTPNCSVRSILPTSINALPDAPNKLPASPNDLLTLLLSTLAALSSQRIVILINSLDASTLRRPGNQSLLARLASSPQINLLATADTPNFPLLWDSTLREQFNFVFHDCTTFAAFDVEMNIVDDVHDLLGRSGRRIGGKEGVGFVLRSLPENARNLYRVLITETLTVMGESLDQPLVNGLDADDEDDPETEVGAGVRKQEDVGVEYRHLYAKAAEEFICSSEMAFRTLLKEFHDHQMIISRKDAGGTELLSVPLGKEEMEGVLEDLVIG